jgi:hypothetical protein
VWLLLGTLCGYKQHTHGTYLILHSEGVWLWDIELHTWELDTISALGEKSKSRLAGVELRSGVPQVRAGCAPDRHWLGISTCD